MTPAIATATRCHCGQPVLLLELPTYALPHRWQAHCDGCLDPTEDAGERAHVVGYGGTPPEALWDWQSSHDQAWGIEWHPTAALSTVPEVLRQAAAEFARQGDEGWCRRIEEGPEGQVVWWEPNRFETARRAEMGTGT